ncbi:ribosomal protein L7/L12 [Candidatus Vidania fulgoroideorum]
MKKVKKVFKCISKFNLDELYELIKLIEEKYSIKTKMVEDEVKENIKTSKEIKNITLIECGPNKISVIKLIKEITGLNLLESKKKIDNLPQVIKRDLEESEFSDIKSKFSSLGCKVE